MRVSAFTFIKNGQILGYPFIQSIQSILPIVDEFVINVGQSEDDTLALIQSIMTQKFASFNQYGTTICTTVVMSMVSKR